MRVSDILSDESKWTKGAFSLKNGSAQDVASIDDDCFCLLGACAVSDSPDVISATRRAIQSLFPNRIEHPKAWSMTEFNDHPDTTFADVRRVLELAGV